MFQKQSLIPFPEFYIKEMICIVYKPKVIRIHLHGSLDSENSETSQIHNARRLVINTLEGQSCFLKIVNSIKS